MSNLNNESASSGACPQKELPAESQVRAIFDRYLNDKRWSPDAAIARHVFLAMWYAALPVERINEIGKALAGYPVGDLQPTLDELVKGKVLRRFKKRGVTHYEVNY